MTNRTATSDRITDFLSFRKLFYAVTRYLMNNPLDRNILINRFKDIETNTPVRKEKFRKLDELYQSIKDDAQLTPQEILNLTKDLIQRGLTIRQTFFSDAIHPILSRQIEQGNVEAIKLMVKLEQHLIAHQGITKVYGYTAVELINKGIQLAPNDKELLQMYEVRTANYLHYSNPRNSYWNYLWK